MVINGPRIEPAYARHLPVLAADSNVFIDAQNGYPDAKRIVEAARAGEIALVSTGHIADELAWLRSIPPVEFVEVHCIHPEIRRAAANLHGGRARPPSEADLSLLQLALQDPRIDAIVTRDGGILGLQPHRLISRLAGRRVDAWSTHRFFSRRWT